MELLVKDEKIESSRENFLKVNQQILLKILSDNADTAYGRRYGFESIRTPEQYCMDVPVSTYKDYEPYIKQMQDGETGTITAYEIYSMVKTSGSTQASKYFPVTIEALKRYGNVMDRYMQEQAKKHHGKRLMLAFFHTDMEKESSVKNVTLVTTAYYRYLYEYGLIDVSDLAGGRDLNFFPDECDYLYAKLWLAFAGQDLVSVESIFLYDVLLFFKYMEDHYEMVLNDMSMGQVSKEVRLSNDTRKNLLSIQVSRERIDKVRRECEAGFEGIAKRLWKGMKVISGIGSTAFEIDEISLKKYIGDIPVWHYIFGASECFMAVSLGLDSYDYVLLPDSAYYEFRSIRKQEAELCDASGLLKGEEYELVLTTFSGLYRYRMGDVIKITGFYGTVPVFRFMYRKNLVLNIAGEKFDAAKLDHAVKLLDDTMELSVWQYYFYEDYGTVPACYHGIIGLNGGGEGRIDEGKSEEVLDRMLKSLSEDYEELRKLGSIHRVRLDFVDRDRFLEQSPGGKIPERQSKAYHIRRLNSE